MLAKAKTDEEQTTAQTLFDSLVNDAPVQCSREPDSYAIVREDTGTSLGTVGNRYFPVQNSEGLDILDPVIGDGAHYETAGSLHGGRVVWLLAKVEKEWSVTGSDTFQTYLLVYLSHDGSKPITVRFVTVRVVCANTLAAAIRGIQGRCNNSPYPKLSKQDRVSA